MPVTGVQTCALPISAKQALARAAGAELVLLADAPDLVEAIRAATGGDGVRVSYDGVGAATWPISLKAVQRRGMIVSFGNASGPVTGVNLGLLAQNGSLFVTRPTLAHYTSTAHELQVCADDLFAVVQSGAVKVAINQRFALKDAAQAHDALTSKQTTGATILIP